MSVQLRENGEQLLKKKKNVKRKPLGMLLSSDCVNQEKTFQFNWEITADLVCLE